MFNVLFGQFVAPSRPLTPPQTAMSQRTEHLRRVGYAMANASPACPATGPTADPSGETHQVNRWWAATRRSLPQEGPTDDRQP